jgi:hypothetical protein
MYYFLGTWLCSAIRYGTNKQSDLGIIKDLRRKELHVVVQRELWCYYVRSTTFYGATV